MRDQAEAFDRRGVQVLFVDVHDPYRLRYLMARGAKAAAGGQRPPRPIDAVENAPPLWQLASGGTPWPVLADPAGTAAARYGVAFQGGLHSGGLAHRPALFIIDRDGVVRFIQRYKDTEWVGADQVLRVLDDLSEKRRLINVLAGKNDPALAAAAAAALNPAGADAKAAVTVLSRALRHEDAEVRVGAAAALRWLGARAEPAVPALVEALGEDAIRDRELRARRADDSRIAASLQAADLQFRYLVAETVGRIGPPARAAAPGLVRALIDADAHVRATVEAALSPPPAGLIFPTIIDEVKLKDDWVRLSATAMTALDQIGPAAVPALVDALADDDADVRALVAGVLGRFGDSPEAGPALARLLANDKDPRVRRAAVRGLSDAHYYDPALVRASRDADVGIRRATIAAFEHTDGLGRWEVLLAVVAGLDDKDAAVRAGAYGLLDHRADGAVPLLVRMLGDQQPEIRLRAAGILARLADEAANHHGTDERRLRGHLADEAAPALARARFDKDPQVRAAAADAGQRIEALKAAERKGD